MKNLTKVFLGIMVALVLLILILFNSHMKEMSKVQNAIIEQMKTITNLQSNLATVTSELSSNLLIVSDMQVVLNEKIKEVEKENMIDNNYAVEKLNNINDFIEELDMRIYDIETMWDALNFGKFTATAYSPFDNVSGIENDGEPECTATGTYPNWGTIAVDPAIIPYYSNMIIIGEDFIEHGIALDTGGTMRKYNYWIDLYRDTYKQTLDFGKQDVLVIWK